ncbi:MAG: sigma 54-interacting transcriptional regulator [Thermodesulfobacteriota bacterium]
MNENKNSQPSVLLLDDDQSISESISTYLEDSGYEVLQAADGNQGMDMFQRYRTDLLLLDLRMPGKDGLDILKEINRQGWKTPVIVITGAGVFQDAITALKLGAFDFITKPILDMALLEHTVQNALEQARLKQENEHYRKHLEQEIAKRNRELQKRTEELEKSNQELQREISERKSTEKQLREMIGIFEGYIYTCTRDLRIDFMNRKLIESLGFDAAGEKCHQAIFGQDSQCDFCRLSQVYKGHTCRFEFYNQVNKRWYYAVISPIFDKSGAVKKTQTLMIDITSRKKKEEKLRQNEASLRKKTKRLQEFMRGSNSFMNIIGKSGKMQDVFESILKASESSAHVIIYGESGTGKELVAKTIHNLSERGENNFVPVHCGALPENLVESEFFGYRKGAFTGADSNRQGFLDTAHRGTLFMDEIGELNLNIQVKLLRALEGGGYTPVGSNENRYSDFRIVAATNRDLKAKVEAGELRNDFFYRVHIIPIHLPPLKEHKEDIPLLIHHFVKLYNGNKSIQIPPDIMESMLEYDWPGNVRELQNAIHQYLTFNKIDFLDQENGSRAKQENTPEPLREVEAADPGIYPDLSTAVQDFEKQYIQKALEQNRWHRSKAARSLGIDRRTLLRKIRAYGME